MSLDETGIGRKSPRFRSAILAGVVAVTTLTVIAQAQPRAEDPELMQKRLDAFEELFAPHFARVDRMSDGRLREYIAARVEGNNALGNFDDYLDEHPQVAGEYRRLLFSAVRKGDWSAVFIVDSAPPRFLLDTWIEAMRPGGGLRDKFLKRMASRDVGKPGSVWKILEGDMHQEPDYRLYRRYTRAHPVEEAAPLVEYMLRTNPLLAMDALLEIYPDQLPDAAAVFDDHWTVKKADWMYEHGMRRGEAPRETTDALNRLSRHDVWWVRLYALSAMTERGPFRLPHRVRDLRDDPNDAVNRAANAISPPEDRGDGARTRS